MAKPENNNQIGKEASGNEAGPVKEHLTIENSSQSAGKALEIKVSADGMEATLTYNGSQELTSEKIFDELKANKVVFGIDNFALSSAISFSVEQKPIQDLVIAMGTPPEEGHDGHIKYVFDTTSRPAYEENKDGSIDIRETHAVQSVIEEAEIAHIIPHEDSKPGKDVCGKVLFVEKVKKVKLIAGKNVRVSEDGLHFFASVSGLPIVETGIAGSKISISETFSIPGNLDLAVGNIDFIGNVEIGGNVEDGFKVKASKNITLKKGVGACDIEAGGDIRIHGGCSGKGKANITCVGNLEAHFLNGAYVKVEGDVIVHNGILNSNIFALGRVHIKSGSIMGGSITAKKGIECYNIGSEMGVSTVLISGKDFKAHGMSKEIDGKIAEIEKKYDEISMRVAPLLKNKELLPKLSEKQKEKLRETIQYLNKLRAEKERLAKTKDLFLLERSKEARPEVVAHHYVFQGVLIKIGQSRREISSRLEGPLRLYEVDETISSEPYSGR